MRYCCSFMMWVNKINFNNWKLSVLYKIVTFCLQFFYTFLRLCWMHIVLNLKDSFSIHSLGRRRMIVRKWQLLYIYVEKHYCFQIACLGNKLFLTYYQYDIILYLDPLYTKLISRCIQLKQKLVIIDIVIWIFHIVTTCSNVQCTRAIIWLSNRMDSRIK